MGAVLPPPPLNSPNGSIYWLQWYTQLTNVLNQTGYPFTNLSFTGSNITSIQTRNHNDTQNIQGGQGTVQLNSNHWHATGRGYVTSGGTGTGFPAGWTVSTTGTGVYVITHSLGIAAPNISAIGTSNTSGVVVQQIDLSNANQVTVFTSTPGGSAANGNFSVAVWT